MPQGTSDEALAKGFVAGDAKSVAFVRDVVRRTVRKHTKNGVARDDAEDVLQECLLAVYRGVPRTGFLFSEGFEAYVRCVSHARCVDYVRRSVRSPEIATDFEDGEPPSTQVPADRSLHARRQLREVLEVLARASPGCRQVFVLRCLDGVPYGRIAALLGRSEGALRVQMHEILAQIRRRLDAAAPPPGVAAPSARHRPAPEVRP